MKSFLKYTLATITGLIIVNIVMMFIFFGFIGAIASFSEKTVVVKNNSILTIKLDGEIVDRTSDNPLESIDFLSMTTKKTLGLNKILKSIDQAAKDDRIKGIYLNLTDVYGNFGAMGTIEEIRNALLKFKESGKFIYSYSNLGYSQKSYFLACIADKIYVNPETPLILSGMSSNIAFYKDMLDKLGVKAEVVKVGKFKSAVEPYIDTKMSDANREQVQKYINSIWGTIVKGISEQRNISEATINEITDKFDFYSPQKSLEFGFFDGVIYEDEMIDILKKQMGVASDTKLTEIELTDYQLALPEKVKSGKDKIAVIYAQGGIGAEQTSSEIGPELALAVRKAREDKNVKAVVLRVNSPGGSALTSDIIWREVDLTTKNKPLIASMGNVAASGGYYISCAADTIVADPTTLTGSIGIFGLMFSGEDLIKNKIGIKMDVVKTNKYSDFGGSYPLPYLPISSRSMSPYEKDVLQRYVEEGYESFLGKVMAGRGFERDELDAIAQGRVWTGEDALKLGLVDVLGGLDDAIAIAANKAGLENYSIVEYPVVKNPLEELLGGFTTSIKTKMLKDELGPLYENWSTLKSMIANQGLMARIPYDIYPN